MIESHYVAPYDPCVACSKGDTATGLAIVGNAEHRGELLALLGADAARADLVEDGDAWATFARCCPECAEGARMGVAAIRSGRLPAYRLELVAVPALVVTQRLPWPGDDRRG